eukprot:TRINITY_DN66876_c0_g1_i1.p1 TRINITY_DN66876_c0_g1~~TRINITY_DN66876_c0_g1_i1.p1  ORF type:complete len:399 (-),score=68.48 TRINITY_DN66876_c0_g1_i1:383-1402(-)
MDMAKGEVQSKLEEALDPLEEVGLFPFNLLGQALKQLIPTCMTTLSQQFQQCISNVGMSGFIHLIVIEMLPVYFFCYSVYNILDTVILEAKKYDLRKESWPSFDKVETCLQQFASDLLWTQKHFSAKDCYKEEINAPYKYDQDVPWNALIPSYVLQGCLLLCGLLWVVVVGSFLCHVRCTFWRVPFQSGRYLQFTYTVQQGCLYRYVAGFIALGALLSIIAVAVACAKGELLLWFIQSQLCNVVMVVLSARAFIVPTKPKFNFKHADFAGIRFRRTSFFQINGSFATVFGNALLQCSRSKQFRRRLMNTLEQPDDWERVMDVCLHDYTATSSKADEEEV